MKFLSPQSRTLLVLVVLPLLLSASILRADAPCLPPPSGIDSLGPAKPPVLRDVDLKQRLENQIPADLAFTDESGQHVQIGDFFGHRPLILTLVYFRCPMLCTMVLNDLTRSMNAMDLNVGKDFDVLTISFDPAETPQLAAEKKKSYLRQYRRDGAAAGWHFLTGDASNIKKLTDAAGFYYVWDEKFQQFAHPSGIIILTPEGKISRYFFGIDYAPKDLQMSLTAASENRIGSLTSTILAFCFHYDPSLGKYTFAVLNLLKIGGIIMVGFIGFLWIGLRRIKPPSVPQKQGPPSRP